MKKKGFTLIELLAVIVILAIIAVIVTPVVSNVIDKAGQAAFKESMNNMIEAGNNYIKQYTIDNLNDPTYPIIFRCNGEYCINDNGEKLELKGKTPVDGNLRLNSGSNIYVEYLTDGKYCAAGTKDNMQVLSDCDDIDVTGPKVSLEPDEDKVLITITDKSGAGDYCVTTTNDINTCSWITNSDSNVVYTAAESGLIYVFAKDSKGNASIGYSIIAFI